jgi:steroid delta-isomerase-like uncharacterized protein
MVSEMAADVIQVVKEQLAAFNGRDWDRYLALHTEGVIFDEEPTLQRFEGREAILQLAKRWVSAFPDVRGTVQDVFASGRKAVLELLWEGTHQGPLVGPFGTLPATGKRGKVAAVQVLELDGERIAEVHHYFDLMTILLQMGLAPEVEEAAPAP